MLDQTERQMQLLSHTDELTQTHNRRYFMQYADQELKRSQRSGEKFSIAILDLDNFKQINDQWGHLVGDHVLREISRVFKEHNRGAMFLQDMEAMNLLSFSPKRISSKSRAGRPASIPFLQNPQSSGKI